MTIKAKICGLTTSDAIEASIKHGADYLGFVFFHKSPRNISAKQAGELTADLPKNVKTVAVTVDATDEELENIFKYFKPDYLQLHGNESEERINQIHIKYAIPVIKAIPVRCSDDVAKGVAYANIADILLFDAKIPSAPLPGGNGLAFDWTLLKARKFNVPWLLSGGLNIQNVKEAVTISGATIVDVSSSLESEPGVKDVALIEEFLQKVKSI